MCACVEDLVNCVYSNTTSYRFSFGLVVLISRSITLSIIVLVKLLVLVLVVLFLIFNIHSSSIWRLFYENFIMLVVHLAPLLHFVLVLDLVLV